MDVTNYCKGKDWLQLAQNRGTVSEPRKCGDEPSSFGESRQSAEQLGAFQLRESTVP